MAKLPPGPAPKWQEAKSWVRECAKLKRGLMPLGAQARLSDDKAQACLCCSSPLPWAGLALGISFFTFYMLLAVRWCWGVANGRPLSAALSCFLPAVCESSSSWEHRLMPPQRMTFIKAVAWGFTVGAAGQRARREGERSGYSGRWTLAQGGCRMPSSICLFPFNLLLSRADQLEL